MRILSERHAADSVWAKAKQWLGELFEKIKGLLGLRSDAPVLRALDAVMNADGSRQSQKMLSDRKLLAASGGMLNTIGQSDGIIRVKQLNAPTGPMWVVIRKGRNGDEHLGYHASKSAADEQAAKSRVEANRASGVNAAWWVEDRSEPVQPASRSGLDGVDRAKAVRATLNARSDSIKTRAEGLLLEQRQDRKGFCFKVAAEASAAGVGDMVIGSSPGADGPIWHAVVVRDGMVYDPTFAQWFEPGIYESLGFKSQLTLTGERVRDFIAQSGGMAPDARNQGLGDEPLLLDIKRQSDAPQPKQKRLELRHEPGCKATCSDAASV